MVVRLQEIFQHTHISPAQQELAIRYLQTKDEELLQQISVVSLRDNRRRDFAWDFTEAFKRKYKKDPIFFRFFYHVLGEQLLNVLLVRFTDMSYPEVRGYMEKAGLALDELVISACKQMTKLAGSLNDADHFLRGLIQEQPQYIQNMLQTLTSEQRLMLIMLMLDTDYETYQSYTSLLEKELLENVPFVLRLTGQTEAIPAVVRFLCGESEEAVHLPATLPDVTWRMLFRIASYSKLAGRYIALLAQQSPKMFMNYAHDAVHGHLGQSYYKRDWHLNEKAYKELEKICLQFGVSRERFFAYSLMQHEIGYDHHLENSADFKLLLRKIEEEPSFLQQALPYLNKSHFIFVSMLLQEKGYEWDEARVRHEFIAYALQAKPTAIKEFYRRYLLGELPFEEMARVLQKPRFLHTVSWRMPIVEVALLWDIEEAAKREAAMTMMYSNSNAYYEMSLYELLSRYQALPADPKKLIADLLAYGVTKERLVSSALSQILSARDYNQVHKETEETLSNVLVGERESLTASFLQYGANERALIVEVLAKANMVETRPLLLLSLGDSSKRVRAIAAEMLMQDREAAEEVAGELSSKKKTVREQAMRVLLAYKDERYIELVREALQEKKNVSLVSEFAALVENGGAEEAELGFEQLCQRLMTPQKRNALLQWLGFEPQIRLRDSEAVADGVLPLAYFSQYLSQATIEKQETAETIRAALHEQDLQEHAQAIYQLWLSQGADVKKRGVLTLYGLHSNEEMVLQLKKQIDEWALQARGAIAANAVQALALSSTRLALMTIQSMAFSYKQKQVRSAANEALSLAAKARGITEEELEDQLVPDLGFNKRGEKTLDYGSRTFLAYLTPDLKVALQTEEGKQLKSLPKPNAKDDATKAEATKTELALLKKQLRSIISMQTQRLEMALSQQRYWSQQTWQELFVENPIMQQFAISLIWGEYQDRALLSTFRYMEDGTLNTLEEEEHELTEGTMIGLVHPLELSVEERESWSEQLADYEIAQPFAQLARDTFLADDTETTVVERFAGFLVHARALLGKMTKYGWSRGSVQDAGFYYSFYKEDMRTGIGAELMFEGASVGYEEEEVCVFEVQFYKAGTVKRGSYEYDEIDDARRMSPKQVPPRLFSELLYDVSRATETNAGRDEHWRTKR